MIGKQVWHEEGPFANIQDGDRISVRKGGNPLLTLRVDQVRNYSLNGVAQTDEGPKVVKITLVGTELRCYITCRENVKKVHRKVEVVR